MFCAADDESNAAAGTRNHRRTTKEEIRCAHSLRQWRCLIAYAPPPEVSRRGVWSPCQRGVGEMSALPLEMAARFGAPDEALDPLRNTAGLLRTSKEPRCRE